MTWTGSGAPSSGSYCVRADIEAVFGSTNVERWADLNNDGNATEITARIVRAIQIAEAEVNDRLRGGPYSLPFSTVPVAIENLTASLAGVWLYESRGVEDTDPHGNAVHRLTWHKKNAQRMITEIHAGLRRFDDDDAFIEGPSQQVTTTTTDDLGES
jgi:phage gp36-like protein